MENKRLFCPLLIYNDLRDKFHVLDSKVPRCTWGSGRYRNPNKGYFRGLVYKDGESGMVICL